MKEIALDKILKEIKNRREVCKESQAEIAEKLGVSLRTYHSYESGDKKIPGEALLKLSHYYRIDLNLYLLTGETVDLIEEVKIHNVEQKLDLLLEKMDTKFSEFRKELAKEFLEELRKSGGQNYLGQGDNDKDESKNGEENSQKDDQG